MRDQLAGELSAAADQLQAAITTLIASDIPAVAACKAQLRDIVALKQGVANASPAALTALSSQIAAVAASAASSAQSAVAQGSSGGAQMSQLLTAQGASRQAVNAAMDGMKDLDPYLKFTSAEDERAYRERERERRAAIEREQSKGTPEGELAASQLALAQMNDAKDHGAGDSLEFQRLFDGVATTNAALKSEVRSAAKEQQVQSEPAQSRPAVPATSSELADTMAALKAAGVRPSAATTEGHGLNAADAAAIKAALSR